MTLLFALAACTPQNGNALDAKDEMDGLADTIDHGSLVWGSRGNRSMMLDGQTRHSWTFTLSEQANVTLETAELGGDVDTVMYLYHWGEGASEPTYLLKNDDGEGLGPASLLSEDLGPGDYIVQIIAKGDAGGAFAVYGQCEGEGCPPPEECDPQGRATLPAEAPFTSDTSGAAFEVILDTTGDSEDMEVTFADRCEAGPRAAQAIELYVDLWVDVMGWDEMELLGDPEPDADAPAFWVGTRQGDLGTIATVSMGGDEDSVHLLFDGNDTLIGAALSEQSPEAWWFYASESGVPLAEPDPACVIQASWAVPHGPTSGPLTGDLHDEEYPSLVQAVVDDLVESTNLQAASVTYETWQGLEGQGAVVRFQGGAETLTRWVIESDAATAIDLVAEDTGGGPRFACRRLD